MAVLASVLGLALVVTGGVVAARVAADTPAERAAVRSVKTPSPAAIPSVGEPSVRSETASSPAPSRASAVPARAKAKAHVARGRPQRLLVPELGVDVPVIGIDVVDGVLLPPDDAQVLGWWRHGARPGARRGSSLITGHTVSSGGGAFDDLDTLGPGDDVTVRTTNGVIDYEVTRVRIFKKASLARHAARVFSQQHPGRLVLITCEDWNGSLYLSNAVVFAAPVHVD